MYCSILSVAELKFVISYYEYYYLWSFLSLARANVRSEVDCWKRLVPRVCRPAWIRSPIQTAGQGLNTAPGTDTLQQQQTDRCSTETRLEGSAFTCGGMKKVSVSMQTAWSIKCGFYRLPLFWLHAWLPLCPVLQWITSKKHIWPLGLLINEVWFGISLKVIEGRICSIYTLLQ